MRSSTSSFRGGVGAIARRMGRERALGVAVLVLGLVGVTVALRDGPVGLNEEAFWQHKFSWAACADVVLAGDSRVAFGVAPAAMAERLPALRIRNFAFPATSFTPEYLDAIERVVDRDSRRPTIVLGVTPSAFLPAVAGIRADGFRNYAAQAAERAWHERWLRPVMVHLEPMRLDTVARELNPWRVARPTAAEIRHRDGWAAQNPPADADYRGQVQRKVRRSYAAAFARAQASARIEALVLARVREWIAGGVTVVAFEPPVGAALQWIEEEQSGFDVAAFVAAFEAAGGRWLAVTSEAYVPFDDSHLDAVHAWGFSRELGSALAAEQLASLGP